MPFKSFAHESYMKHNEPEIYEKWIKKYGHYKGKKLHVDKKQAEDLRRGYRK